RARPGQRRIRTEGRLARSQRLLVPPQVSLELHPDKTRIVYCKDADRRDHHEVTSFVWVFGDRDSGRHLVRFSWTAIVRHRLVTGGASPTTRPWQLLGQTAAAREPHLGPFLLRLLQSPEGRCPRLRRPAARRPGTAKPR